MMIRYLSLSGIAITLALGCSRSAEVSHSEASARTAISATTTTAAPTHPRPSERGGDTKWTHPGMAMSFSYDDKLLKVSHKPDGATLESEVLGSIEDRSGEGEDKPQRLTITLSVRVGKLAEVRTSEHLDGEPMESGTIAGRPAYRDDRGSHDVQQELFFVELPGSRTLEIECDYLGDMGNPKVPFGEQRQACQRVVSTLSYTL